MASNKTFRCVVVTPERLLVEADCTMVVLPAHDGLMGVQRDHAPLIGRVGRGPLRLDASDGTHRYQLDGGFMQIKDNLLTILSDRAEPAE